MERQDTHTVRSKADAVGNLSLTNECFRKSPHNSKHALEHHGNSNGRTFQIDLFPQVTQDTTPHRQTESLINYSAPLNVSSDDGSDIEISSRAFRKHMISCLVLAASSSRSN